ncbi:restriction endonuclease subunit S [Fictibacillus fluitans]|uniref:Restriction endonuclease subunit S n=1 Tax=Fictibacillus fluitans TaxID=3058422 RepID=A0ABT8HUG1_9BACL|nr:restriction endonuclease subunit S [Fictibacillus sp. NE201]MDN4524412.1 restriction endonuclease subunit S [Fictibacillus sp. NE201]
MTKKYKTFDEVLESSLVSEEDQPYEIPENWVWVKLGSIIELAYGKSLPNTKRSGEGFPVYGSNGVVGYHEDYLIEGPVIVIGRKGSHGEVNWYEQSGWPIDTTYYVKVNKKVSYKFIYYLLLTVNLKGLNRSTAIPGLNREDAYDQNIALPPINEQKRIIEKVERLLNKIEEAEQLVEEAKKTFELRRAAILDKAFRGGLTRKWREENLGGILRGSEPRSAVIANKKSIKLNSQMSDISIPDTWEWVLSNVLFSFVTSGSRGWAKYYSDEGDLFLRVGNLNHETIDIDLTGQQKVNLPEGTEGTRTLVQEGDILVSITADVGRIAVVPKKFPKAYINQHIALARPSSGYCIEYVAWFLSSRNGGRLQFDRLQRGATKAGLGLNDIKSVWIPIPLLDEQYEIVRKIKSAFNKFEVVEKSLNKTLNVCEELKISILSKAYKGKIGTNDLSEENALELLKKVIREQVI